MVAVTCGGGKEPKTASVENISCKQILFCLFFSKFSMKNKCVCQHLEMLAGPKIWWSPNLPKRPS